MIDHPILLFAFALANIITGLGWIMGAFWLLPRSRMFSTRLRAFGCIALSANALAHWTLAFVTIFDGSMTAEDAGAAWPVFTLHLLIATTTWMFLYGAYVETGENGSFVLARKDPSGSEPPL